VGPSPTASALPTPSPTPQPPLALNHCTGKTGGTSAAGQLSNQEDFAGYLAFNGTSPVSCVEASWIMPAITCSATDSKSDVIVYLAINGNDGKGTSESHERNEKISTEAYCVAGLPNYSAWTFVRKAKDDYRLAPFGIRPRDQIWAQVRGSGSSFKLTLVDVTSQEIFTRTDTVKGSSRLNADWSVQTGDSGCPKKCVSLPLAKFGTVTYLGAEAVIGGVLRTLDHWPHQITTMATGSLKRATVSRFGKGTFTVTWRHK
jgi:hypothetical protein